MPKRIVILTEKKDQAEKLCAAMGWTQDRGCWSGKLEGASVTVVTARGHLLTLQSPDEVIPGLGWNEPEKMRVIPRSFPMKIIPDVSGLPAAVQAKHYISNINKFLKGADELIIATDSDREGEAIGWSIVEYLGFTGRIRRAWFAAGLDKKSLTEAMRNLKEPSETKSYYRASQSRSFCDWAYMFLVRAYTHYASYSCFGANLGRGSGRSAVVSVGRVQTPTLAMIVKRDIEIETFVSKDHHVISGHFSAGTISGIPANYKPAITQAIIDSAPPGVSWESSSKLPKADEDAALESPLYTGKAEVEAFRARLLRSAPMAKILSYTEGVRKESPPKPFALTDATSELSSAAGISSGLAQTVFEDLYEQGWTSYARTSKSDLPMNLYEDSERNAVFDAISGIGELRSHAERARGIHNGLDPEYKKFTPAVFVTKDMEHYGIIPTSQQMSDEKLNRLQPRKADKKSIAHTSEHMKIAYMLVARRYILTMMPPAQYATQEISFGVPVEDMLGHKESVFQAKAEKLTDPGWRALREAGKPKTQSLPALRPGQQARVDSIELTARQTKPPVRYVDKTLFKAMENIGRTVRDPKLRALLKESEGIGTPATRKTIVETLIVRGYVEVKKNAFHSTKKGRDLIAAVPDWLSNPETTALWEDYLVKICKTKDDAEAVQMRDKFVEKQLSRIEGLISHLISTHSQNLGERQVQQRPVSPKIQAFIRSICDTKGISAPAGVLSDYQKARAFLDEHAPALGDAPTEKQLQLLESLRKCLPDAIAMPPGIMDSRAQISRFIDANKKYLPPSPGAKAFAQKLIARLGPGQSAPADVLESAEACSAFIDEQTKGEKKAKSGARKPGATRSQKPVRRGKAK